MHHVARGIGMKKPTQLALLLKRIRREQRCGQRSMALAVGIPASNWARFETGERWPSLKTIKGLKRLLGMEQDQALADGEKLAELDTESLDRGERNYLKHKWQFELYELKRSIATKKKRLQQAIDSRAVQREELHAIDLELNPAQGILNFLKEKSSGTRSVSIQQDIVNELVERREHATTSAAFLSNVELRLMKADIELLELKKGWLQAQIES